MYSVKKNVLQTVSLFKLYGIDHIVLSPGSRNAPLIQCFTQDSYFKCHIIVDERNAAFYGIGLIQKLQKPVAICCTSGTALLNYAPAVAEAFYQQLPLIVLSADRTPEWIGQMDGQIIAQYGALNNFVKKSVALPEIKDSTDEWYCNRLLNDALIASTADAPAPVHINLPIAEPLFDYSVEHLPDVRKITAVPIKKTIDIKPFVQTWKNSGKRMIIVGQLFKSEKTISLLDSLARKADCVVLCEHLSNCVSPNFVTSFDALLYKLSNDEKVDFTPGLVITIGGHIVSKRIKHFLREHKPASHWHINESGEIVDLFQSLTDLVETDTDYFLAELLSSISGDNAQPFHTLWNKAIKQVPEPNDEIPFSDIWATGKFLKRLPQNSSLHLANSSTVRNVQLYEIDKTTTVYCNRGTNGIESSLPSAIGFASVHDDLTYLIIGDLSFFYGLNALWNISHIKNLRILLINNGGGGIFHLLPGLNKSASLGEYVAAGHNGNAKDWAKASGLYYLSANSKDELETTLESFFDKNIQQSVLLEVSTDMEISKKAFQDYYHNLKTK